MNLSTLSGKSLRDSLFTSVSAQPREVNRSNWSDVRIECRQEPSDLSDTVFSECRIVRSYFGNARLNVERVCFVGCELREVTFMYGRLRGATFRNCEISNCLLRSADLREARFEGCTIKATDFAKADFSGAVFQSTVLARMEKWGWHGFQGAEMDDSQRYKFFVAANIKRAIAATPIPADDAARFQMALEAAEFGDGEAMFIYEEWKDSISFPHFVAIAKEATTRKG